MVVCAFRRDTVEHGRIQAWLERALDGNEPVDATGNLVPDAYIAALASESGAELITTDRDYARFPGLRWRHPLR